MRIIVHVAHAYSPAGLGGQGLFDGLDHLRILRLGGGVEAGDHIAVAVDQELEPDTGTQLVLATC